MEIAVLITCYNRCEMTMRCLENLSLLYLPQDVFITTFLVDDGSSDGTAKTVSKKYPFVKIIKGDGNLYWAGGMRLAWNIALNNGTFDYFFLLNDDTFLYQNTIIDMISADKHCMIKYGIQGLYVGSTCDPETKNFSYGARKLLSYNFPASINVIPNGTFQMGDLLNANILIVPNAVVKQIGILSEKYIHLLADYDYSLKALKFGIPRLVLPNYCGECISGLRTPLTNKYSLRERIRYLYDHKGFAYNEYIYFIGQYFPNYLILAKIKLWLRTFFPFIWKLISKN